MLPDGSALPCSSGLRRVASAASDGHSGEGWWCCGEADAARLSRLGVCKGAYPRRTPEAGGHGEPASELEPRCDEAPSSKALSCRSNCVLALLEGVGGAPKCGVSGGKGILPISLARGGGSRHPPHGVLLSMANNFSGVPEQAPSW